MTQNCSISGNAQRARPAPSFTGSSFNTGTMRAHASRAGLFQRRRRPSSRRRGARGGDPPTGASLGGAPRQPHEHPGPQGCVQEDHRDGLGGHLQHAPRARLERRARPGIEAVAGLDPLEPPRRGEAPETALAKNQARHGGLADSELQSAHVRGGDRLPAGHPLRHPAHRLRRLPAAFLDRAPPSPAFHLRHAAGGRPSARHGLWPGARALACRA